MGGALPSGGAVSDADAQTSAGGAGGAVAPAVKSKWRGRIGLAVGALLAVSAVVGVMILASVPRPDATLSETDEDVSLDVLQVVNSESRFEIDTSTLRSHEIFEGWDVWSGSNAYGSPCLVAIAPTGDWVRVECTPSPGELFADTFPYPLRGGGIIRFELHGDTVEAWVYPAAEAE